MREKLLELIAAKPKQYVRIVKNTPDLLAWVNENSIISSESLVEHIYSAVHQQSNICPRGKVKQFGRVSTGFKGCGPASICECTRQAISSNVIKTKMACSNADQTLSNEKRRNTMLAKYGVEFNSQRDDIKQLLKKPKISDNAYAKLTNREWLDTEYNVNSRTLVDIADELGVYYSTVAEYCKKFDFKIRQVTNYSLQEREIVEYVKSLGITNVIANDWETLITQEIDILLPDHKLGIEVNGLYWHSYYPKLNVTEDPSRHIVKTKQAKECGIDILHVTDSEWINKRSIVQYIIQSKLNLNNKIPARKCTISNVSKQEERVFLDQYHLQGYIPSSNAYGLYFNGQLMMLLSVGKSRYDKSVKHEVLRVCSRGGITVIGGLSKLVSGVKREYPSTVIVTYCDLDKSTGNAYRKSGFVHVKDTDPGFFWTDGTNVIPRYKTQHATMRKWLLDYNPSATQRENMFNAGYRIFWNCGNSVFYLRT